jgi:pSer/pThr/pTyr-binding forkhead associated (FHA) protein
MQVNLVLVKKGGSQKSFPLPSSVTVIGRRGDCDLCVPLSSVSRRHCQLSLESNTLKVRDLDSRNGTLLNGKLIDEATVGAGDLVEVGPLKFVFQIDGKPENVELPKLTTPDASGKNEAKSIEDEPFVALDGVDDEVGNDGLGEGNDPFDSDMDTLLDDLD